MHCLPQPPHRGDFVCSRAVAAGNAVMAALLLQTKGAASPTAPLPECQSDLHGRVQEQGKSEEIFLRIFSRSSGILVQCTPHKTMAALLSGPTAGFFKSQICPELFEPMETSSFPNLPTRGAPQVETEGEVTLNRSRSCLLKHDYQFYRNHIISKSNF